MCRTHIRTCPKMICIRNDKVTVFNKNTDKRLSFICIELGYTKKSLDGVFAAMRFPLTVGKYLNIVSGGIL